MIIPFINVIVLCSSSEYRVVLVWSVVEYARTALTRFFQLPVMLQVGQHFVTIFNTLPQK